jgi:hypothetical protein
MEGAGDAAPAPPPAVVDRPAEMVMEPPSAPVADPTVIEMDPDSPTPPALPVTWQDHTHTPPARLVSCDWGRPHAYKAKTLSPLPTPHPPP